MQLAVERASEVAAKLDAIPQANRVARVKAMQEPKFKSIPEFTLLNGSAELGYNSAAVTELQVGELTAPIRQADGVQLLILAGRKAPEKPYAEDQNLEMMYRNYKASMIQMEYSYYLMSNCKRYAVDAEAEAVAE